MQIAIDLSTRSVLSWAGVPVDRLAMTRGDKFPVDVKFIYGNGYLELPGEGAGKLFLKHAEDYAGGPLAGAIGWEKTGSKRNALYSFYLNLHTAEMDALFADERAAVVLTLEIQYEYLLGNLVRQSTLPVLVDITNDYIRDEDDPTPIPDLRATEADAVDGTSNSTWMTPLATRQAIESFLGGSAGGSGGSSLLIDAGAY